MARSSRRSTRKGTSSSPVFAKRNYVLLLVGIALIVVGFSAMRIDNQLEGFISLYVAPLIILGGYLEIIYAILWRPSTASAESRAAES